MDHSPGLPIVSLSEKKNGFFFFLQFSSCLWWEGMISSTYFMADVEQFLFLIEVFIAVLILNK